ncbi:MAG: hypothetical protein K8J09_23300 [Planctomycetes bacterium]|nr:hypothetical protein [Planctomycetota bacterium]MCC7396358.1 hypothetical protein [Planctomycetota bacterium]
MLVIRALSAVVVVFCCLLLQPRAQDPLPQKDEDEVKKLGPVDPYTGGDKAAMAAAGVVAYGPFAWADFLTTADVDRVLGEGRVLWMETAHFKFGVNLRSVKWPDEQDQRKLLQDEVKLLRKTLPKLAERPKKIDPWLRVHLYAARCEKAYAEFQKLIGVRDADFPAKGDTPPNGAYLGLPGKFLVLLFQKKSDMVRYMDRFCGRKDERSMRYYHQKTNQMLLCVSAEGMEGVDECGLYGHVTYAIWHNLMSGYQGFQYPLPPWFAEGLAQWYARKVPTDYLTVEIKDDEAVAEEKQHEWPIKVRRRAQHEGLCIPFATMAEWPDSAAMGYHAHTQSWSRIDYLMRLDAQKVGQLLRQLKNVPPTGDWEAQGAQVRAMAQKLLFDLYELDAATFDQKWRDWVLKTYPKK